MEELQKDEFGTALLPFVGEWTGGGLSKPSEEDFEMVQTLAWTAPVCRIMKPNLWSLIEVHLGICKLYVLCVLPII